MKKRKNIYPTYEEAKIAANKLGIKSWSKYHQFYKQDPRLPSDPYKVYMHRGWTDWYDFFEKEKRILKGPKRVPTKREAKVDYETAKKIVADLKLKTQKEYLKIYKSIPGLPFEPRYCYKNRGWNGWKEFLRKNHYPIYQEAKMAAKKLGLESYIDYRKRHHLDPLLPSCPDKKYSNSGWIGWYDFLGSKFYESYEEARAATRKFGFQNAEEYWKGYKQDKKLHSKPYLYYKDKGWIGWTDFLKSVSKT